MVSSERRWNLRIATPFAQVQRRGEMIFVGGQADLGSDGEVRHAGDLENQTAACLDHVEAMLAEHGADMEDVVKVVVFYVSRGDVDEAKLLGGIARSFPGSVPPALMAVPLPALCYPELYIQIECIAMRRANGERLARAASNPEGHWDWPFSHGVRCDEMIFVGCQQPLDRNGAVRDPGGVVTQARSNIDDIAHVLAGFGAGLEDVCRFNTFYVGHGTAKDWTEAAQVRGNAFPRPGVCGTGVPVPVLFPGGLTIRQEATAMLGRDGSRLPRTPSLPEGHWDWPIPVKAQQGVRIGDMIMIGGQVSADATSKAVHPDDLVRQTEAVMTFIQNVVEDLGGTMADIVKLNAFYKDQSGADPARLHETLSVQSARFEVPGPVCTAVPLRKLGMENLDLEIEGYAVLGDNA